MNRHEETAFDAQVKSIAAEHGVPVSHVGQLAQTILRDGMSEPDMFKELAQYCAIWRRRDENG